MRTLIAILALAACTTGANVAQLQDRGWTLVSITGVPTLPAGVKTPTIRFGSDGRLSGDTGCNRASATYTIEGDRLTIGPMITTKRACVAPEGNTLERAYVEAIGRTTRYRIAQNELELLEASGDAVARFR